MAETLQEYKVAPATFEVITKKPSEAARKKATEGVVRVLAGRCTMM
jgi:hypothetical protein